MSVVAPLLLAASGLAQAYVCEASSPHMTFMGRNLETFNTVPPVPAMHSSFEILVDDKSVIIDRIDGLPPPSDFQPFLKLNGLHNWQYFSERSDFFRAGKAEPTIMTLIIGNDNAIRLMASLPLAFNVTSGPAASGDQMLPAIEVVVASCSVKEKSK